MTPETIQRLNAINQAFYATIADDFDATRQTPWAGWFPLLPHLIGVRRVLDVGCGNGRFALFLREHVPTLEMFHGVDNNAALLARAREALTPSPSENEDLEVRLFAHDVVDSVLSADLTGYDAIGLFGVLHHIPGAQTRLDLMRDLAGRLNPNGVLMVAAWRFLDDDGLRARLVPWPDDLVGEIEDGDALLDWRRGKNALRYCHHCDDAEFDALMHETGLTLQLRYFADGSSGRLNLYGVGRRLRD
jgi:SAM-dependent methyltransferase